MTDVRTLPWSYRLQLGIKYLGLQLFLVDVFVFVMLSVGFLAGFYAIHSLMAPPFWFGWVVVAFLVFTVWIARRLVTWLAQSHVDFVESSPNWHDGY